MLLSVQRALACPIIRATNVLKRTNISECEVPHSLDGKSRIPVNIRPTFQRLYIDILLREEVDV